METYDGLSRTPRVCGYTNPGTEGLLVPELDGSMTYVKPLPQKVKGFGRPINHGRFDSVLNVRHPFDTPVGRLGFSLTTHENVWDSEDHLTKLPPLKGSRNDNFIRFMNDAMMTPHARIHTPVHLVTIKSPPVYRLLEGMIRERKTLRTLALLRPKNRWIVIESEHTSEDEALMDAMREHHVRSGAPARVKPTDYNPRFAATDDFVVPKKDRKVARHTPDNVDKWYYLPNLRKLDLYVDEDEDEEYTENQAMPNEHRSTYEPLMVKEVDYFGISPYKKDYKPKVRSYWIGEVYRRNRAAGQFSSNLAETVAKYFNVHEWTVRDCARRAELSNVRGTIVGTDIPATPPVEITGDWVLKNYTARKYIKPWMTADGIRPWWMWTRAGNMDNFYAAERQKL